MPLPTPDDPACTAVVRERLAAERERWIRQLDDTTRWVIDNVVTYAAGWPLDELRSISADCAVQSRMITLSERTEETKVELLGELAAATQNILSTYWWRRVSHHHSDRAQLAAALARLAPDPAS